MGWSTRLYTDAAFWRDLACVCIQTRVRRWA